MAVMCVADPYRRPVKIDFVSRPLTAYNIAPNATPKEVETAKFAKTSCLLPFMNLIC